MAPLRAGAPCLQHQRHAGRTQACHPWPAGAWRQPPPDAARRRRTPCRAVSSDNTPAGGVQQEQGHQQQPGHHQLLPLEQRQLLRPAGGPAAAAGAEDDAGYMGEYAALKQQLLDNTRKSGGAIGLYLLLTVGGGAALAAMVGTAASYGYFTWLCRDVDAVRPTDTVPLWEANKIENPLLRRAAKLKAAWQKALSPRLVVPAALGCLVGAYGQVAGEPMPLVYSGSLLLGFLAYKAALVVKLVDDLTPKSFAPEAERPVVEKFEDEFDQWGRPKKRAATPIDAMPEDARAKAYEQLERDMEREARREQRAQGGQ